MPDAHEQRVLAVRELANNRRAELRKLKHRCASTLKKEAAEGELNNMELSESMNEAQPSGEK